MKELVHGTSCVTAALCVGALLAVGSFAMIARCYHSIQRRRRWLMQTLKAGSAHRQREEQVASLSGLRDRNKADDLTNRRPTLYESVALPAELHRHRQELNIWHCTVFA